MLKAALTLLLLSTAAAAPCGGQWKACCKGGACRTAGYSCQRGKCKPCAKWMYGACCTGDACPATIDGVKAACQAARCIPCGSGKRQPVCPPVAPVVQGPLVVAEPADIVLPGTAGVFYNYLPAPPSFNPQKMHSSDEVTVLFVEPVYPATNADADNKPLPQDAKGNTMFRKAKTPTGLPFRKWKYPIDELIGKSLFFYEVQRSGVLPADNRVPWRGDSPKAPFADGDFGGGWYDAGDHVKFNLPMTYSASRLAMSALAFAPALDSTFFDGQSNMYWVRRELAWVFEYILRCHPDPKTFVAQVGDGDVDHSYLGRAETMTVDRPVYKLTDKNPGPDLTASAAGTMALCNMLFAGVDDALATRCSRASKSLYALTFMNMDAVQSGVTYDITVTNARKFYTSSDLYHHIFFASSMMYLATGQMHYRDAAHRYALEPDTRALYGPHKFYSVWPSWDNGWFETAALMVNMGQDTADGSMAKHLKAMLASWVKGGGGVTITPKGGRWLSPWGSNRYAANAAGIAMLAARALPDMRDEYQCFAVSQLHYLWGDTGRSFVVGAGKDPPVKPHHRNSICTLKESMDNNCNTAWGLDRPNPNVLHGALIGGPGKPDDKYVDNRNDYVMSEVATDYNALYTVASAGAASLDDAFWSTYKTKCKPLVPKYPF
jgi:endoglucanase